MVRNSARGCDCNYHYDSCNPRRGFVHSHNLEQYTSRSSPHPSVTFSLCRPSSYGRSCYCGEPVGWWQIPRSHSRYCPVSSLSVRPYCLESYPPVGWLATGSQANRASTSHLKRSRPVLRSYILKRTWGVSFYGFLYLATSSRNRTFS
jgi:hypothetical protein